MLLANANKHPRDDFIQFFEVGHKYVIRNPLNGEVIPGFTSTTTWIHTHFAPFDEQSAIRAMKGGRGWNETHRYWGWTEKAIKEDWEKNRDEASTAGTAMHAAIEDAHNLPVLSYPYTYSDLLCAMQTAAAGSGESVEYGYFRAYVRDHPTWMPYRTEWTVFHEEARIAGSIDMIYRNPEDGTLRIYDWKRAKEIKREGFRGQCSTTACLSHIQDSNYWHYALQLNIYKYILESKYGQRVTELCLVRFHPNADNYEMIPVPFLTEEVNTLFQDRMDVIVASEPCEDG